MSRDSVLEVKDLSKSNKSGSGESVNILSHLNLSIYPSETVAIVGESGSGKTTLLSLLAGLDEPSSGSVWVGNQDFSQLNENELARFRANHMGIIFQQFYLMKHLSSIENIALPLEILRKKNAKDKAKELLNQVGLSHRENHLPNELSGGEIQRIAIARALVTEPDVLLADEPTGNLDKRNAENVAKLLFDLVKQNSMTLVLVTHNTELAKQCKRTLRLDNGSLSQITN